MVSSILPVVLPVLSSGNMAVFMLNVCKFNDCGLTFKNLGQLIQHIEETHIDYDPKVVEQKEKQQPSCIPLSYVLRFFTDAARAEIIKPHQSKVNYCQASSFDTEKETSREAEIEDYRSSSSEPENSNDSWAATTEEFSTELLLRYANRNATTRSSPNEDNLEKFISDKPFACPVPGCKKRYKNVNGIKYHSKNGHKHDSKIRKAFNCPCGKNYKTLNGLKNHTIIQHGESISYMKLPKLEVKTHEDDERLIQEDTKNKSSEGTKVSAMEDHVYVKQNCSMDRDLETLGILTPAQTPPQSFTSPVKSESSPNNRHIQTLHNYFAIGEFGRAFNN